MKIMTQVRALLFFKCIVACAATAVAVDTRGESYFRRPGPSLKEWRMNTNFENVDNWEGLSGHENCSQNIYSFPPWYDQENVVMFPSKFIGKQIILPVNGHFVFREGTTKFLATGGSEQEDTCRELKFLRASQADWFDPNGWLHIQSDNEPSSLLNTKTSFKAVPHVERVPCQYDSARFPENSSFNLKISSNVSIAKFYLGDKVQSYTNVALLMNSPLGKFQFRKSPETIFSITDNGDRNNAHNTLCLEDKEKGDSDLCICSNYMDQGTRQRICSLTNCDFEGNAEDNCPNPITPHGFCCPICGFHVKIRHSGNLRLIPLYGKLKTEVGRQNLQEKIQAHLARYKANGVHLVLVPNEASASTTGKVVGEIAALVSSIESILKQESEVIGVTMIESWGGLYPSGGSSDRLAGSSLGAGTITLLVILCLAALLGGIALAIFIWNKKSGYPAFTLSSVTGSLPRMSDIRIPIVPGAGRRSSTLSGSLQSFGFARFTNERVSTVTIGADSKQVEGGSDPGSKLKKSSSLRRAEQVDDQVPEKVTDAKSGAYGFTNVTYDLVAGASESIKAAEVKAEKENANVPILQIPEIKIKDTDEPPVIQEKVTNKESALSESATAQGTSSAGPPLPGRVKSEAIKKKEEGKGKLPGFVASRIAKAYRKLGPEEDIQDEGDSAKESEKKEGAEDFSEEKPISSEEEIVQSVDITDAAAASSVPVVVDVGRDETLVNLEE